MLIVRRQHAPCAFVCIGRLQVECLGHGADDIALVVDVLRARHDGFDLRARIEDFHHRLQESRLHHVVGAGPAKILTRAGDRFHHPSVIPQNAPVLG